MSRSVSPEKAARVLGSLPEEIEGSEAVTEALARAILQQARRAAQLRPTPQAEMAAEGLGVRGDTILSLSGGAPAEVAVGSEFGSGIYRQFHKPHNPKGYWLLPSANDPDPATIQAGEEAVDQVIEAAIRGI